MKCLGTSDNFFSCFSVMEQMSQLCSDKRSEYVQVRKRQPPVCLFLCFSKLEINYTQENRKSLTILLYASYFRCFEVLVGFTNYRVNNNWDKGEMRRKNIVYYCRYLKVLAVCGITRVQVLTTTPPVWCSCHSITLNSPRLLLCGLWWPCSSGRRWHSR